MPARARSISPPVLNLPVNLRYGPPRDPERFGCVSTAIAQHNGNEVCA
jgi:hypothetical protein